MSEPIVPSTAETTALVWSSLNKKPSTQSELCSVQMSRADTPFGQYVVIKRETNGDLTLPFTGFWFANAPSMRMLGPFGSEADAKKASEQDFRNRSLECLALIEGIDSC